MSHVHLSVSGSQGHLSLSGEGRYQPVVSSPADGVLEILRFLRAMLPAGRGRMTR